MNLLEGVLRMIGPTVMATQLVNLLVKQNRDKIRLVSIAILATTNSNIPNSINNRLHNSQLREVIKTFLRKGISHREMPRAW